MRKNFTDVYELKGELGLGGYSICRECCHKKTGEEFAVKVSLAAAFLSAHCFTALRSCEMT